MRMRVHQRLVTVLVRVWNRVGYRRIVGRVRVLVVRVVDVRVFVHHLLVPVLVLVSLRDVQPDADCHQRRRGREGRGRPLAKDDERHHRPDEWRR